MEADPGFYTKLTLDYFPVAFLGVGTYLSYGGSYNERDGDLNAVEIGLAIKPRLPVEDALLGADSLITPGLSIGYRGMFTEDGEDSDGLGLNIGLDLRLRWKQFDVFVEPGILSQVTGGNSDADVTFDGVWGYFLVGVGVVFSLELSIRVAFTAGEALSAHALRACVGSCPARFSPIVCPGLPRCGCAMGLAGRSPRRCRAAR